MIYIILLLKIEMKKNVIDMDNENDYIKILNLMILLFLIITMEEIITMKL